MSQWTHVVAAIRFDALRSLGMGYMKLSDLGHTVRFEDPSEKWARCDVPKGSEGSLQTHLVEDPDESSMAAYTATIWGDLRDYEDVGEIVRYLDRICRGRAVRSGVAKIDVEGQPIRLFRYSPVNCRWTCVP